MGTYYIACVVVDMVYQSFGAGANPAEFDNRTYLERLGTRRGGSDGSRYGKVYIVGP